MNSEEIRFLDDARFYVHEKNLAVLPLDGKRPPRGISWKHLTSRLPTDGELQQWARIYRNLGVICGRISRVVALDADDRDTAERLINTLPPTDMITKTPRGVHLYYRIRERQEVTPRVRIGGMMLDVRGEISYVVAPRSIHPETGQRYERVGSWNLKDVPFFDPSWIEPAETSSRSGARGSIRNLDAYLAKVESIQGRHGSAGLVRACALCRDCGLTEAAAVVKLITWNQSPAVQPPWELDELARAVSRTYKKRIAK